MPEGRCENCQRLIFDTEKVDELPDVIICQHCGHPNVFRVHTEPEPTEPEPYVRAAPKPKKSPKRRRA